MAPTNSPIIVKKVRKAAHAHHGGAWKIAYADFVTAMMAFFLLLWLISMTTPEQREGLADYFAPPRVEATESGAGGPMGGQAPDAPGTQEVRDADADRAAPLSPVGADPGRSLAETSGQDPDRGGLADSRRDSQIELSSESQQIFQAAAVSIRQAWNALPDVAPYSDQLLLEVTEDGLNIEIVNQEGRPMFSEGSRYPLEPTREAIAAIAPILQRLPNQVRISGHTAAGIAYSDPNYGQWELSADRANVVRGLLGEFGLADNKVHSVVGRATSEPYFLDDPYLAANERIKITVMNAAPPVPPTMAP